MRQFTVLLLFFQPVMINIALGQITSQSGAITGVISDPSGAAITNARVTLNSDTRWSQMERTGSAGEFTFPLLMPGVYTVTVEVRGFNRAIYTNVSVEVTKTTNLNATLQVGSIPVEITVSEATTLVNPTDATLGNTLAGHMVEDLPLATRNFTNLLSLNAGTSSNLPNAAAAGRGSGNIFVNGQRGTANNLVINGIDANNFSNNNLGNVATPAPDTIEQFRVQTSLYDASQGKTSGGNINVITKTGGPAYHGELYEYFRNDVLNANSFFFNKTGTARPELRQNQFGGNFGGPVPSLQKWFFFASYEGTRQINALSGAIVGLFPVLPAQRTQANIESAFGLKPGSLAPVALRLLNAKGVYGGHLMPSGVNAPPGQFGNLTIADPLNFNDNQLNTNADYLWSDRNRISMKLFRGIGDVFDPFGGQGAQSLGSGLTAPFHNYLASLSDTWTVTPSITNEARLGYDRNLGGAVPKEPVKLSDIGMARFNEPLFPGIPYIITNDPIANFGGIGTNYDQASATNTYQFADTTAWVRGRHSLSAGIEYRRYQVNASNNFASRGFLQFASYKDFLTGGPIATSFVGTGVTVRDFRARDVAAYMQDDYKVTSRLTLNIGLRYDYMGPSVDRRDRLANVDPSRLDADTLANGGSGLAAAFVLPASFKSSTIQGTPGVDRSTFTNLDKTNFAPRMGFSWDPFGDGKTAIRGGYGIYYIRISNQTQLQLMTALPFFETSNLSNPGTTLANPFPELPLPSQFPMFPAFPRFQGYNAAGSPIFSASLLTLNPIQRNLETPYAEQYNFTMQRELPAHWVLEAGYTGSQGVHLLNSLQVNQALLANANTPIRGLTANSTANYNARVTVSGLSPSGLNEVTNAGHSSFNAFVFTVNRRVSKMFFQGAYTFSRSIDNNSGSATQDLGTQIGNQLVPWMGRGLSDFDRTHRVTATYEYDFGSFGQGLAKAILGGWILGGLTTFQSAVPVAFSCATCTASTNVYGLSGSILMPDVIGNLKQLSKGGDPRNYFDPGTNAFNTGILAAPAVFTNGQVLATNLNPQGGPGNQTYVVGSNGSGTFLAQLFGTLPRNPGIRGRFQQQWDVYVAKVIPIREKLKLRFDGQFFNLFNHTVFAAPSGAVGSSAFGRISSTVTQPRIIQIAGRLEF